VSRATRRCNECGMKSDLGSSSAGDPGPRFGSDFGRPGNLFSSAQESSAGQTVIAPFPQTEEIRDYREADLLAPAAAFSPNQTRTSIIHGRLSDRLILIYVADRPHVSAVRGRGVNSATIR